MAELGGFAELRDRIRQFEQLVSGQALRQVTEKVGKAGVDDINAQVRTDLGDNSFSNWRRGKPIPITATSKVVSDHEVDLEPARPAKGPMRVLTDGRKAYVAGDRRNSGTRVRKKDGVRVQKTRLVKGTVGATKGRGTWTSAMETVDRRTPHRVDDEIAKAMRKAF